MADYIDRDKVLEAILDLPPKMDEQGYGWLGRMGVWQMIRDFQSADVAPVKHGRWITEYEPDGKPYCFHCSVCDSDFSIVGNKIAYDYCPDCGAKMDGEKNG